MATGLASYLEDVRTHTTPLEYGVEDRYYYYEAATTLVTYYVLQGPGPLALDLVHACLVWCPSRCAR